MKLVLGLLALLVAMPARAEPAMWVAHGAHADVYLLGSMHLLRPGDDWDGPDLEHAFDRAGELWFEVADLDNSDAVQVLALQLGLDISHKLSDDLTPAEATKLDSAARRAGYASAAAFQQMRPWMAAMVISVQPLMKEGFDPRLGADQVLQRRGRAAGKPMRGFESGEEQLHFFADLPPELSVRFLVATMDDLDSLLDKIDTLVAEWRHGDPVGTAMLGEMRDKHPDLYRRLIADRNVAWAPVIRTMLDGDHDVLITVGAGHLEGPDSVQAVLAAQGVVFERVSH